MSPVGDEMISICLPNPVKQFLTCFELATDDPRVRLRHIPSPTSCLSLLPPQPDFHAFDEHPSVSRLHHFNDGAAHLTTIPYRSAKQAGIDQVQYFQD